MSTQAPPRTTETDSVSHRSTLLRNAVFWLIAGGGLVLFLYVFSSILLPFLAGMALAYFLDPVAGRLQKLGMSRLVATVAILIVCIVALIIGLMVLIPVLTNQLVDFIARLPDYMTRLHALATSFDPEWFETTLGVNAGALQNGISSLLSQGTGFIAGLFGSLWSSGLAIVNIVSLFVITPVVAFYLLLDWDRMVDTIDRLIPRDHLEDVRQIARDINLATAGFIRGQGTLCFILGVYYATGLTLVGLNFGLLIGLFAGLISFIPYVGSFVGLALAISVAVVQFWPDWYWVVAVAAVFLSGQFIEGNILQPKLMGKSVGLHPVWLMFALFAFGYLFGFVGLLIAVPAAAAVAVLVRFALARYVESPLYSGEAPRFRAEDLEDR